jgi:predicted acetyltransferase
MRIEVKRAESTDRIKLDNLMQFYIYDFSEFLPIDMDEKASFKEEILDSYFADPDKVPFLALVDGLPAGFALVSAEIVSQQNQGGRCIKEFFIVKRYRRKRVGKTVATTIFSMYPGKWEVRVVRTNLPAKAFWERVISEYSEDRYNCEERNDETWRGNIFSFQARATSP